MDHTSRITLTIPDPQDFEDDHPVYIPVSSSVVGEGITLLQCILAQRHQEEGSAPDDEVWDQLTAGVAQMLAGLLRAYGSTTTEATPVCS
jgi:hypothetical protein